MICGNRWQRSYVSYYRDRNITQSQPPLTKHDSTALCQSIQLDRGEELAWRTHFIIKYDTNIGENPNALKKRECSLDVRVFRNIYYRSFTKFTSSQPTIIQQHNTYIPTVQTSAKKKSIPVDKRSTDRQTQTQPLQHKTQIQTKQNYICNHL